VRLLSLLQDTSVAVPSVDVTSASMMPWHEEVIGRRTDVVTADSANKCSNGNGQYKQADSSTATITAAVAPTGVMLDVSMVMSTNSSSNKRNSSSGQGAEQDIHVKAKVRLKRTLHYILYLLRRLQHSLHCDTWSHLAWLATRL
jgi:hypothetical protein